MTVTGLRPGAGGTPRGDASGALRRRLGGVLVDTGAGCNLGCRFCPMEPGAGDPDTAQVVAALDVARDAGAERVILVGGEPTIRRDLGAITAAVAARGLRLGLVTNGRMFAYGTVLDLLRGHGLDVLTVGLHGPDAAVHDALVGAPGAFKQTVAGLRAVAAHADIAVEVRAVVGPENLRALAGLVGLVRRLFTGRAQVRLTLAAEAPGAAGRARGGAPAEAHAAAAAMRAALVLAQSVGLPAGSTGLPDCVAADLLLARALAPDRRRLGPVARASCLPDPRLDGAGFTLACAECVRRPECPGPAPRAAVPVRGLRRGSHDLVPVGELAPFAPAPRDCPGAAQARAAGADPARDLLFADGGRVALYRAAGADVPHGELERLGTTEQYYLEPEAPGGARRAVRLA
ncbi:MAG TPA: radical SAM protein, partial [Polyangia bacterium]